MYRRRLVSEIGLQGFFWLYIQQEIKVPTLNNPYKFKGQKGQNATSIYFTGVKV